MNLEGPPGAPKLVLAPAKGGGAPPDACGAGGTAAPSAASPSELAGGRRPLLHFTSHITLILVTPLEAHIRSRP